MGMKSKLPAYKTGNNGFTMVELLIAMVISVIIMGAIFSAYQVQQKTYAAQNQVTEMQQNLRAGMDILLREIRMAGYDPGQTLITESNPGIEEATIGRFRFIQDLNDDGDTDASDTDPNEDITFGFSNTNDQGIVDSGPNKESGIAVGGAASLGRATYGGGFAAIAENIVAIEFNYTLLVPAAATIPPTVPTPAPTETITTAPTSGQLQYIRKIEISLLARASLPDPKVNNTMTYVTAAGNNWGPYNDNYRRRLLISTVQCRNMGLR